MNNNRALISQVRAGRPRLVLISCDREPSLEPCRFCAFPSPILDAANIPGARLGPFFGHCPNCGADGDHGSTRAEAIARWNALNQTIDPAPL